MRHLFSAQRSPIVHMCSTIKDVLDSNESSVNHFDGMNSIKCVASSVPESFSNNNNDNESTLILGSNIFELQYISLLESKSHFHSRSKWNSEYYTRYGGEYTSWWHQERGDHMATKYNGNIAIDLPQRLAPETSPLQLHFCVCQT
jgi:hypothetical protein